MTPQEMIDIVKTDDHYGKVLRLWIYANQRREWVEVDTLQPIGRLFTFDIENPAFIQAIQQWVNLGGMFYPDGVNPNYQNPPAPIYLLPEWLETLGVVQDDLTESDPIQASLNSRDLTSDSRKDAAKKRSEQARVKLQELAAQKTPYERDLEKLVLDFVNISEIDELTLDLAEMDGYSVERQGDLVKLTK